MTLPFRRRHNDAETSHDRARSLIAAGFIEPIEPADATWLGSHLGGCLECRTDAAAYDADRLLLRSLRDRPPEPPRDLWARTAAEIERSHGRGDRAARRGRAAAGLPVGRIPLGVASGFLVVLVVVGAALLPKAGLPAPGGTDSARATAGSEATRMAVDSDVAWIQLSPDGSYEYIQANVHEVCADVRDGCAPLNSQTATRLNLNQAPQAVLLSPLRNQIAVVTKSIASSGADIVVVTVPKERPVATPSPVPTLSLAPSSPPPTSQPTPTSDAGSPPPPSETPTTIPTTEPTVRPSASLNPSGSPEPGAGHAIVRGVIVVGEAAYSANGDWLAFSARPADGTGGPDLYDWHIGDPLATVVTTDHRTFFAGWLGNRILANRVEPGAVEPVPSGQPGASGDPTPSPTVSGTVDPAASPGSSSVLIEDHPVAFILDPASGSIAPLGGDDVWHPTVDPRGRSVVYWSGTLVADGTGTGWKLGTGHLVIDRWLNGEGGDAGSAASEPPPTASPRATAESDDASSAPGVPTIGPAGNPVALTDKPIAEFDAWFDPTGTRLAVWIADPVDATIGTLRLVVIDPDTRQIDASSDPLPAVAALRGVSINNGRLAWVTPPGQDGQGSHVQVLAWKGREFGQVRTIQGDRFFVAR